VAYKLFSSFHAANYNQERLTVKGGSRFLFLHLIERCRWCSVFPWLRFV